MPTTAIETSNDMNSKQSVQLKSSISRDKDQWTTDDYQIIKTLFAEFDALQLSGVRNLCEETWTPRSHQHLARVLREEGEMATEFTDRLKKHPWSLMSGDDWPRSTIRAYLLRNQERVTIHANVVCNIDTMSDKEMEWLAVSNGYFDAVDRESENRSSFVWMSRPGVSDDHHTALVYLKICRGPMNTTEWLVRLKWVEYDKWDIVSTMLISFS